MVQVEFGKFGVLFAPGMQQTLPGTEVYLLQTQKTRYASSTRRGRISLKVCFSPSVIVHRASTGRFPGNHVFYFNDFQFPQQIASYLRIFLLRSWFQLP